MPENMGIKKAIEKETVSQIPMPKPTPIKTKPGSC